ncbi:MAG: hypothetical protein JSS27_02190 [Planctomycetes bacterium]|nr:hypothetical protein [Planctomycetota bacterium]
MEFLAFISPDEAILRILAGPLIISAIALLITIPVAIRRRNMAINDPEKYRRMVAYEEEERERHKKRMADAAATGATAARVIAKFLKK